MYQSLRFICIALILLLFGNTYSFAQSSDEQSDKAVKKQAEKLFEAKQYDPAYKLYSQLLVRKRNDPQYSYRIGVCIIEGGAAKKVLSIQFLETAAKSSDVEKEAIFYLGKAYMLNYRFAEAIEQFKLYKSKGDPKIVAELQPLRQIDMCKNGLQMIRNISDWEVVERKDMNNINFYRSYTMPANSGKLLPKPPDPTFTSAIDKKIKAPPTLMHITNGNSKIFMTSLGEIEGKGKDIYMLNKLPNGSWGKMQVLPSSINTEYDEEFPCLHPNGKTLFFSSKGHSSMGGYDIFKSTLDESKNTWSEPINLGFPINSPDNDMLYLTDIEEKFAYFSSSRSSSAAKKTVYKLNLERKPLDYALIRGGVVSNRKFQSLDVTITVINIKDKSVVGIFRSSPINGAYFLILPNGGDFLFKVDSESFGLQSKAVRVPLQFGENPMRQEISYELNSDELRIKLISDDQDNYENTLPVPSLILSKSNLDLYKKRKKEYVDDLGDYAYDDGTEEIDTDDIDDDALDNSDIVKLAREDAKQLNEEAISLRGQADIALKLANEKSQLAQSDEGMLEEANEANLVAKRLDNRALQKRDEANLSTAYADALENSSQEGDQTVALEKLKDIETKLAELSKKADTSKDVAGLEFDESKPSKLSNQEIVEVEDEDNQAQTFDQLNKKYNNELNTISQIPNAVKREFARADILDRWSAELSRFAGKQAKKTEKIKDPEEKKVFIALVERVEVTANKKRTLATQSFLKAEANRTTENDPSAPINRQQINSGKQLHAGELTTLFAQVSKKYREDLIIIDQLDDEILKETARTSVLNDWARDLTTVAFNQKEHLGKIEDKKLKDLMNVIIDDIFETSKTKGALANRSKLKAEALANAKPLKESDLNKTEKLSANELTTLFAQVNKKYREEIIIVEEMEDEEERHIAKREAYTKWSNDLNKISKNQEPYILEEKDNEVKDLITVIIDDINSVSDFNKTRATHNWLKAEADHSMISSDKQLEPKDITSNKELNPGEVITLVAQVNKKYKDDIIIIEKIENEEQRKIAKATAMLNWSNDLDNISTTQEQYLDNAVDIQTQNLMIAILDDIENESNRKSTLAKEAYPNIGALVGIDKTAKTKDLGELNADELKNVFMGVTQEYNNELVVIETIADEEEKNLKKAKVLSELANELTIIAENQKGYIANESNTNSNKMLTVIKDIKAVAKDLESKAMLAWLKTEAEITVKSPEPKTEDVSMNTVKEVSAGRLTTLFSEINKKYNDKLLAIEEIEDKDERKRQEAEIRTEWTADLNSLVKKQKEFVSLNKDEASKDVLNLIIRDIEQKAKKNEVIANNIINEDKYVLNDVVSENQELLAGLERKYNNELSTSENIQDAMTRYSKKQTIYKSWASDITSGITPLTNAYSKETDPDIQNNVAKAIAYSQRLASEKTALSEKEFVDDVGSEPIAVNTPAPTPTPEPIPVPVTAPVVPVKKAIPKIKKVSRNSSGISLQQGEAFEIRRRTSYSSKNPIPVDQFAQDGLIYAVQVGAFKNEIPQGTFRGITPINAISTKSGYLRYLAGKLKTLPTANQVKEKIKGIGFKDAFVVAFYNGKRISISEAEKLQKSMGGADIEAPIAKSNDIPNANTVRDVDGLFYTVQIGVFSKIMPPAAFNNLNPLHTQQTENNKIRYVYGVYQNKTLANEAKQRAVNAGMKQAFVVVYNNSKRITMREALAISSNSGNANNSASAIGAATTPTSSNNDNTVFTVQVGVFSKPMPSKTFYNLAPLQSDKTAAGTIKYTYGKYNSREQANVAKDKARAAGVTEAFVTIYRKGKKVPKSKAIARTPKQVQTKQVNNILNNVVSATDVDNINGLFYTVQVGVYSKKMPSDVFYNLKPLQSESLKNGTIRYTVGMYSSLDLARSAKANAKNVGIKEAFVIAYNNGSRIPMGEAKKLESGNSQIAPNVSDDDLTQYNDVEPTVTKSPPKTTSVTGDIVYKVQIGAYKEEVPIKVANLFFRIAKKGIDNYVNESGITIYTVGEFNNYEGANDLKQEMMNEHNLTDSFIVAYKNGKKVALSDIK